jgi:uncharacterized protein YecA (UPF0149 family)
MEDEKKLELVDNPMDQELTEEELTAASGDISKTAKFKQIWHQSHTPWVRISEKIGRNEPCPCGSGKKYKNCCINKVGYIYKLKDDPT